MWPWQICLSAGGDAGRPGNLHWGLRETLEGSKEFPEALEVHKMHPLSVSSPSPLLLGAFCFKGWLEK